MAFNKTTGAAQPGSMAYVYAARAAVFHERGDLANYVLNRDALDAEFISEYPGGLTRMDGVDDLLKEARQRLSGATHELEAIEAAAADLDSTADRLIAKMKAFNARIAAFNATQTVEQTLGGPDDGETGGLDTSSMVVSGWGAALHQKLLTGAGAFSSYLQGASNTPTGGGTSVAAWVPTYTTLRDG